jgi:hypothetical protein
MKRFALVPVLVAASMSAQAQKPTAQTPMPTSEPASPCAILKRMGPADEITSRLYAFGIRGKQFQYVEGNLPQGISFHGRLTDHDVRNILDKGGKVQILEPRYTSTDLEAAHEQCSGKVQVAAPPSNQVQTNPSPSGMRQSPVNQTHQASVDASIDISSSPSGADVELDGSFVGDTPSAVGVLPGDHTISVKRSGYRIWEKKIKITSGKVSISAELEPEGKESSGAATATTPEPEDSKQKAVLAASEHPVVPAAPANGTASASSSESFGTVSFTSDPSGAEVYVDDALMGKSPLTLNLKIGHHYARMFAKDYKNWSQQFTIVSGAGLRLTAVLEKAN